MSELYALLDDDGLLWVRITMGDEGMGVGLTLEAAEEFARQLGELLTIMRMSNAPGGSS